MSRTCTRCRKTFSGDLSKWFFRASATKSGFATRCKKCRSTGLSPGVKQRIEKRQYEKNKKRKLARCKANYHYRNASFMCCVVGCINKAEHLHHVDYDAPLAVIPLCAPHHMGVHNVDKLLAGEPGEEGG